MEKLAFPKTREAMDIAFLKWKKFGCKCEKTSEFTQISRFFDTFLKRKSTKKGQKRRKKLHKSSFWSAKKRKKRTFLIEK